MLDQEYLDAVKRFNHEIYPKIRLAQSFVACMPNAMRDIARELGEDSYPCRRLKSIGWDQVQETLMEALEYFEKRERRRIPNPSLRWVKPGKNAYAWIDGEILRVEVSVVDEQNIICYGGTFREILRPFLKYVFTESDIDTILFRTEYELLCSVLKPGTSVWAVDIHKQIHSGKIRLVAPTDQDAEGAIMLDCDDGLSPLFTDQDAGGAITIDCDNGLSPLFVRYKDFNKHLFIDEAKAKEKAGLV